MAIERLPSIWDYLSQGLGSGLDQYQQTTARNQALEQLKRQNALQDINAQTSLYAAGAIPSSALSQTMASSGLPAFQGLNIQPNAAELRQKYLSQPGGMEALTPEQRLLSGLPSAAQTSTEAVTEATNKQRLPNVAREEELRRYAEELPRIEEAARGLVGGLAVRRGLDKANFDQIIEEAFTTYKQQRVRQGLPPIENEALVRQQFEKAGYEVGVEFQKLKNARDQAHLGRRTPRDQQVEEMTNIQRAMEAEQNNLAKSSPIVQLYGSMPENAANAAIKAANKGSQEEFNYYKADIARYRELGQYLHGLNQAQFDALSSTVPVDVRKYITRATPTPTPTPALPGGPTPAPGNPGLNVQPPASGSPAGPGTQPQGGAVGAPAPAGVARPLTDAEVSQSAQQLAPYPPEEQKRRLNYNVSIGKISSADAAKIAALRGITLP